MGTFASHRAQHGAIGLAAAVTLLIALVFLALAVDSGRLYLEQRKVQRVADMAVLEAVARAGGCAGAGQLAAAQYALENASQRNGFVPQSGVRSLQVTCGRTAVSGQRRVFVVDPNGGVVRVQARNKVPASLILGGWFGEQVELMGEAVATRQAPIGRLQLKAALATVDTSRSLLLNALFSGLLGGSVNLTIGTWQGLVQADVNLLSFMEEMALQLGLSLSDYDQLLDTQLSLGTLLNVAAQAMDNHGTVAQVGIDGMRALALALPNGIPPIRLGEVLNIHPGLDPQALDVNVNALQLAEVLVQLANTRNSVAAELPLNLLGLVSGTLSVRITEPAQLSAIGDLDRARAAPLDPESRIYVRSAQARTLISVDASPVLSGLANTLDATASLLVPVNSFLNEALSLNLVDALGNLFGSLVCGGLLPCPEARTSSVKLADGRIDVNLDAGGAQAYITDYRCDVPGDPQLTVRGTAALAHLRIGRLGDTVAQAKAAVFGSNAPPVVAPMPVLMMGYRTVKPDSCLVALCGGFKWKSGSSWVTNRALADFVPTAGLGLRVDSPLVGSTQTIDLLQVHQVPTMNEPAKYSELGTTVGSQIVGSLGDTLRGVQLTGYRSDSTNLLGNVLNTLLTTISAITGQLAGLISNVLSPLLDPLLNALLDLLGINLEHSEVGTNMDCGHGARLEL